jgi:uncharacterized repeat protein (TIGR01451 family)
LAGTPDGTPIINQAQVSRGDELIGYLEDTVIVDDLRYPALEISKHVDRLIAFNGDSLNYSILLENTGDDSALNIHMIDPLSDYITLVPGTITGGGYAVDGAVHWTGDIPPSGIVLITYTATIDNNVPLGWAIINRLSTTYDEISEILYASAATEIQATDRLYLPLVLR